uniref:Uncharacterized protein n=1 Tax=Amphimedon queenslandica TaxID=400682 RepID=A0A1X7TW11_AMPQE
MLPLDVHDISNFFLFFTPFAIIGGDAGIYLLLTSSDLPPNGILDLFLIVIVLNSGITILPTLKKSKSLADYCQEAVEDNQIEEERALVPIRNRLRESRVGDHRIDIDLLVELAQLECMKTLGNMYHYGTEEFRNNITEYEMKTIAKVAYRRITTDEGGESDDLPYNTREGASVNGPTERDRLLGDTRRNNNNYSHFN